MLRLIFVMYNPTTYPATRNDPSLPVDSDFDEATKKDSIIESILLRTASNSLVCHLNSNNVVLRDFL
jgi:hypothetical protein